MAYSKKIPAISVALLLSFNASAGAGDYYPPEELDGSPGGTLVEFGTGWYLRGDIGGSINTVDPGFSLRGVATGSNLGRTIAFGVGAGYQVNDYIRFDGTIEHFINLGFEDRNIIACGTYDHDADPLTAEVPITGSCEETQALSLGATVALLNGYLDLGNYGGFTPYVGGGVGMAYLSWEDYVVSGTCSGANTTDCGGGTQAALYTGTYTSNQEWRPAAALMAGFSYDLTKNLKLDAGYKFTYISGGSASNNVPDGVGFSDLEYGSFNIHQVRLGLRYAIW